MIAEDCNLKGYNRISELTEALIRQVLFNLIMRISTLEFCEKSTKNFCSN